MGAILLAPRVATGWDSVLQEAGEAEVPVVLLDRQVDSTDDLHLTAVGSDLVHESEVAGLWLADTAGDEECRIDELQGTTGSSSATDRATGFRNAIEATTISRSSAPGPATSPGPAAGR